MATPLRYLKLMDTSSYTKNYIAHTTGYVDPSTVADADSIAEFPRPAYLRGGLQRLKNLTNGVYLYGHMEVNQNASTPFSRTKVHKGYAWYEKSPSELNEGDHLLDMTDNKHYLIMSVKDEVMAGESNYLDISAYYCDVTIEISRYEEGARDTFGRQVQSSAVSMASGIYAMSNPQNFDTAQQPDRIIAHDKMALYVPVEFKIKVPVGTHTLGEVQRVQAADCITTSKPLTLSNGIVTNSYKVNSVDTSSLSGIAICYVDVDVR